MMQRLVATLPQKTGRSLEDWIALLRSEAPAGTRARHDWLKRTYGLGGPAATCIIERAEGRGLEDGDPGAYLEAAPGYVEAMFSGPKEALWPVYDALVEVVQRLGDDVKVCPARTMVPVYRTHLFAQIRPATRTRVDLGVALGTTRTPPRLVPTGGLEKGDRITHRIALGRPEEVDAEVRRWLRIAYELDR
jgi:hypothetical protein